MSNLLISKLAGACLRRWHANCAALALLCVSSFSHAQNNDLIYASGFEDERVSSDAAAARFLTQASFGPTPAAITAVRAQGYNAWIDQQLTQPATLTRPYLQGLSDQGLSIGQGHRVDRWFHSAVTGPDQLRQRMAFALSQIMVLSDQPDNLVNDWQGLSEYQDILARGAFGSYRSLLENVALSPQMGKYLSHWRNRKASPTTEPDENFAREILQLFSIGLIWRNSDFSPMLSAGQPIPTYDQGVIVELAQVFTGLGNRCPTPAGLCNTYSGLTSIFDSVEPMACFPLFHDVSSKVLFDLDPGPGVNRVTLPAGPACDPAPSAGSALQTQCFNYCNSDLSAALDAIANHPNVAPFFSRQLIQKFVSSNPSPAYVQRVAQVFTDTQGNLGQTLKAVLMDTEARAFDPSAPGLGQISQSGKLREPLLRITAFWRAFGAQPGLCSGSCLDQGNPPAGVTELRMGLRGPRVEFFQQPLGAPSVFNFFAPDFQQPGSLSNANLYSPEFQILNETSITAAANALFSVVYAGYNDFSGSFSLPNRNAYIPTTELDGLPADDGALVDALNLRLLYGSMSGSYTAGNCAAGTGMKGTLYRLVHCAMAGANNRLKRLSAMHVILISTEYSTQR